MSSLSLLCSFSCLAPCDNIVVFFHHGWTSNRFFEPAVVVRQGTQTLFSQVTSELECFFAYCIVHSVVREDKMVVSPVFLSCMVKLYYWPAYTQCRGGQTSNRRWHLFSSVVIVVCHRLKHQRICNVTHQGQHTMTSQ